MENMSEAQKSKSPSRFSKNDLIMGAEYEFMVKIKDELNAKWGIRKQKLKLIGVYPHLAAFTDANGMIVTYSYWELGRMQIEGHFRKAEDNA